MLSLYLSLVVQLGGLHYRLCYSIKCIITRGGVEDIRLEAKDKKIRGQGQGQPFRGQTFSRPRTKDTATSALQKKGFQNSFSGDLQFIGVPRIFDWGRPKPQITCNDIIKIFPKRKFLRHKDIVEWKI